MPGLSELFLSQHQPLPIFEAEITTAPGAADELCGCSILDADYDPEIELDDCPWSARGDLLPGVGDRCLVALAPSGRAWVVVWWPWDLDRDSAAAGSRQLTASAAPVDSVVAPNA
jgi:hypothetical protein